MIVAILSWVLGVTSILGLWLAGRDDWRGWALTLGAEPIWALFAVLTHSWGLLVSAFAYSVVSGYNLVKWRRRTITVGPIEDDSLAGFKPVGWLWEDQVGWFGDAEA